jgi:predicted Zn-dependent protease
MLRVPRNAIVAGVLLTAGLLAACGPETMQKLETSFKEIDPALSEMETFSGSYLAHLQEEGMPTLEPALPIDLAVRQRLASASGSSPIDRPQVANESIIHAPRIQAYLEALTQDVLAEWPGDKPESLRVYLTDSAAPKASAYGTHEIFVAWSLLANEDLTESALRVFIGHELSHILLNHFTTTEVSEQQQEAVARVVDVSTTSTVMAAASSSASGLESASQDDSQGPRDTLTPDQRAKAGKLANASDKWAEWLVGSAWGRRQEEQADLLGIELALRSGGDIAGVLTYARIVTEAEKQRQFALDEYDVEARAFVDSAGSNVGRLALGAPRFLFLGTIAGFSDIYDRITSDYVEPEKREAMIGDYANRQFGGAQPVVALGALLATGGGTAGPTDRLLALRSSREYRAVAAAYAAVAKVEAAGGDVARLQALAPEMLRHRSGPAAQDPAVRLALYQVRSAQGNDASALQNLRLANRDGGAPKLYYEKLAQEHIRRGEFDAAERVIGEGTREIGADWPLYLVRIDLNKARGNDAEAQRIVGLCHKLANERAAGLDDAEDVISLGESCESRYTGNASASGGRAS